MSVAFSRSMRSLSTSGRRGSILGLTLAVLILGLWTYWALVARISLYESSSDARLEAEHAAHPVEAPVAGRVIANHLAVGQQVSAGQVLVELDASTERLQLQEEQTQPAALNAQVISLRNDIESEEQALDQARRTARQAIDETRAQSREATAAARFARTEAERLEPLHKGGFISDLDFLRTKSKAEEQEAVAESRNIAVGRLEQEHLTAERDRQARIERLKGEIARIEAQMPTGRATIKRMEHEVGMRQIHAPVSGRVGEVAELRVGAVVQGGAKLGTIIPEGGVRAVAYFPPQAALGRIQPGQPALIRLEGFPWSQYGSLAATVATVASETSDGRVRVELEVSPGQASSIPLQHGLPGTVEIEVKKASPLMLILQYLERSLTRTQATTG
ncbi:MAG TPA: HlyD family efflux transporter periplasmic adaptor subunit [Pyrinomonadaceae bacterium]|nr:HlyD family efflux transporter periplasmic adaptor subunit [Pyrinomonadaceae bacterium]